MKETDNLRIMIVDDEPTVRLGLSKLLSKLDASCTVVGEARNGVDALQKNGQLKPDLVFTDIRMPKMDGISFTQELAEVSPNTFVVLLTGYADFEYARNGIRASVFDYLLKPVEIDDLREVIGRAKRQMAMTAGKTQAENKDALAFPLSTSIESFAIQEAVKYILDNYRQALGIREVAGHVYLNPSYFSVLFKKETGLSFSDFLMIVRLEKAKELLKKVHLKIYEVAQMTGFQTGRYFTEVFKEQTGMLPSEYRNTPF
ncbi:response regulator transcription factor [Cohnella soli]|uniref:Response regulator n=1 Tax=Cohnella soli TaxID=425005 RepID=A0ABW0HJM1_9BACL